VRLSGAPDRLTDSAAYHAGITGSTGGTVAFGWVRTAAGGPVHVLTVGDALVGSADTKAGEVLLTLPCGARGTVLLRPAELAWLTWQLDCWWEVAGISDALLAAGAADGQGAPRAELPPDEGLLGNWTGPFGWLLIAEPVSRAERLLTWPSANAVTRLSPICHACG
jgi:uncharacterized protein